MSGEKAEDQKQEQQSCQNKPPPLDTAGNSSAPTACQSLPAWHFTAAEHLCLLSWPWLNPAKHYPWVIPRAVDSSHRTVGPITCLLHVNSCPPSDRPRKNVGGGLELLFLSSLFSVSESARCNSTPLLIRKTFQGITQRSSFSSHLPCCVRVCVCFKSN